MTSRYHGSNIFGWQQYIGSLSNDDGDGNENGKKVIGLDKQNNNFARDHAFLHISYPSLHDCDMKLPNFTRPLYGAGEYNVKNFFSFLYT